MSCGVYGSMHGQPRNALLKQLIYGLIGFCILSGIVFAIIYPEGKLSFWAAVFISMTVVAAFGSPVLLVVALVLSSSRKHEAHMQKSETVISTESASWMSYAYCENCERPLRIHEFRSETTGRGESEETRYYCRLCDSRGRKPGMPFFFALCFTVFAIGMVLLYFFVVKPKGTEATVGELLELCQVPLLIAISFFAWSYYEKSKYKPIYDRWVMQHGTDPEKWPGAPKPK